MEAPETRYVKAPDGASIAYQVVGDGPIDIAFMPSNPAIDVMWDEPTFAHGLDRLAEIGRLICLDFRGFGASDPVPSGALPTPEGWMDDLRVVLDAVGSEKVAMVAELAPHFVPLLFAATYPERTSAVILVNGYARVMRDDDYEIGMSAEQVDQFASVGGQEWGNGLGAMVMAPSRANDPEFVRWYGRMERASQSPSAVYSTTRWIFRLDVRSILPAVRAPTLVMCRKDCFLPPEFSDYLAARIPDARLKVFPGRDVHLFSEDADLLLDELEEFVTGVRPIAEPDKVLATVLFTDIVDSTKTAARLGDRRWKEVLQRHDDLCSATLDRHRGRQVKATGDGILATFDGPGRAVRCAQAIVDSVKSLGIEVRAGVHTGEIERRGADITGLAVNIGSRVSALAGPGEVLVTRTVTDLVVGSGLEFEDRGEHELKGVPDRWAIYGLKS
jgi:class 3 adenylate cyclase